MLVLSLIVGTLAVTRITRLFVEDKLMVDYRQWVVKRTGPDSMWSYLVHCPWCTSVWVAIPVMPIAALFPYPWVIGVLAIPASSYLAGCLLDRD